MAGTFTAQVEAFVAKSRQKLELVFKESTQEVFDLAQRPKAKGGNMPVDTGFLRNSLSMALNGAAVGAGGESYVLAIADAEMGDTVFGGWTAKYARHVEYGTSKMAGSFFAMQAAHQWQQIVSRNAERARKI